MLHFMSPTKVFENEKNEKVNVCPITSVLLQTKHCLGSLDATQVLIDRQGLISRKLYRHTRRRQSYDGQLCIGNRYEDY